MRKWEKWEDDFLRLVYVDKTIMRNQIAIVLNRHPATITKKIVKLGLQRNKKLNYEVNENFFEKWTEKSAYILGFIMADGHLRKKGYGIVINVCDSDKNHLQKISNLISPNYKLKLTKKFDKKYNKTYFGWSWSIHNQKLYQSLIKIGVLPNKTGFENWASDLPEELRWHFIRGYFDGDGYSIGHTIGIVCTSEKFLSNIVNFTKIGKIYKIKDKNIFRWHISNRNDRNIFIHNAYKKSTIYLERKYKKIIENQKLSTKIKKWTKKEDEYLLNHLDDKLYDISKKMNRSMASITARKSILKCNS